LKTLDSEVIKYLNKYQINGYKLIWNRNNNITTAVVIPAIKEYLNIRKLLKSLTETNTAFFPTTLFVFVINNTPSSDDQIKKDNLDTLDLMKNILSQYRVDNLITDVIGSGLNVGYIDASTPGNELSEKEGGVGIARKIGMDEALTIFDYTADISKLLICLDADCTVENNYLDAIHTVFLKENAKAASVSFEHVINSNEEEDRAITCYEIFLRYYVLSLKYAGSYYAFHTIGSAMACDHETYIKAEGMNKKKAAEDFYFLEKISKNTKIFNINSTKVFPSGRKSWRVPFGTGQRVSRFHAGTHDEYSLYNPDAFEILKEWLILFHQDYHMNPVQYLHQAKLISKSLYDFLILQNFESNMEKILKSSKTDKQLRKQKLGWFDGFKTLKLIHFLRDNETPNIFMLEALDIIFGKLNACYQAWDNKCFPDQKILYGYLNKLRTLDKEKII